MPPPDASADAGTESRDDTGSGTDPGTDPGTGPGADSQDTLDLHLPDDLLALFATTAATAPATATPGATGAAGAAGAAQGGAQRGGEGQGGDRSTDRHPQRSVPAVLAGPAVAAVPAMAAVPASVAAVPAVPAVPASMAPVPAFPAGEDLLDHVGDWGPTATDAGIFHLAPVRLDRDLALISRWMNDPAVAAFWELSGPEAATEDHLRAQLGGDGRSVPCLGMLDGTPVSYWEIYRADLDRLARHCPARLHDTGIHLLIGGVARRGRGLGTTLLRAVSELVLDRRPSCARVVAEPDLRNTPCVAAFLSAGFRFSAEVELPDKKAALMVRDRALRGRL